MTDLRDLVADTPGWDPIQDKNVGPGGTRRTPSPLGGSEMRLGRLGRTIEGEIIPRLMLAHIADSMPSALPPVGARIPDSGDVSEFAKVLLAHEPMPSATYVDALCARDVPLESIFLDLMAPAARRLGELWGADVCSFTDVTVALGRLQQMLRLLSRAFYDETHTWEYGRRALLVAAPGEQHTFGSLMVAEFLRRAGWDVACEPGVSRREMLASVQNEWFAVVGISVSSDQHLDDLASVIRRIRRESLNSHVSVMVGGNVFIEHPDYVTLVGADATAMDARQAVDQAENVLTLLPACGFAGHP